MKPILPIFLFLLSLPLLPCDALLGTLTCSSDPGQYAISKDSSDQYYVRYISTMYSGENAPYICKSNKLTLDINSSYAREILSELSGAELSKTKANPGTYSLQKDGSVLYEVYDFFEKKKKKTVCRK